MSHSKQGSLSIVNLIIIGLILTVTLILFYELNRKVGPSSNPALVETRSDFQSSRQVVGEPPGAAEFQGDVMRQIPEALLVKSKTMVKQAARKEALQAWQDKRNGRQPPDSGSYGLAEAETIHKAQLADLVQQSREESQDESDNRITPEDVEAFRSQQAIIE